MGRDSPSLVEDGERNVASSKRPPRCVLRPIAGPDFVRPIAASLASRGENPEQRISLTDDSANIRRRGRLTVLPRFALFTCAELPAHRFTEVVERVQKCGE